MDWLIPSFFTDATLDKKKDENTYSKEEIILLLEKSFDNVYEIIKNTNPELLNEKV